VTTTTENNQCIGPQTEGIKCMLAASRTAPW